MTRGERQELVAVVVLIVVGAAAVLYLLNERGAI
jgi:hypothetical protein